MRSTCCCRCPKAASVTSWRAVCKPCDPAPLCWQGVPVRRCRIRRQEESILLALSEEEAKLFPGWLGNMEQTEIQGERRMLLRLNADGTPPFSEEAPEAPLPAMPEEPAAEVQEAAEEPEVTTEENE